LNAIIAADQESALTTGYAVKETRVRKLNELAERIEQSVIDRLWVPDVKGVGSGDAAQIVDFEYFNKAGVDAYRGVVDDIAAEVGGRVNKNETIAKEIDYKIFDIDELTRITNGESETAVYADALKRIAASQSQSRA
jgi:hypothetical protein